MNNIRYKLPRIENPSLLSNPSILPLKYITTLILKKPILTAIHPYIMIFITPSFHNPLCYIQMLELQPVSKYRKQQYLIASKNSKTLNKVPKKYAKGYSLNHISHLVDMSELQQQPYEQRQFEDSNLTKFLHQQYVLISLTLTLLGMVSITLSFMTALISFQDQETHFILSLHSVLTCLMLVLVHIKYFKGVKLKKKQLIKEKRDNKYWLCLKSTYLEIIILLFHPNLLTKDTLLYLQQPVNQVSMPYHLNNFFEILMLLRIYLLYNSLVKASIYCTPRANRMCRIYNAKNQADFGIKSVFNASPVFCLVVLSLSLSHIISRMMMLAQENNPDLQVFQNCLWLVIITMGTVGYGQIVPTTYVGRLISFIAAISGIILSSLLILTLSQKLAMNSKEYKSHITLKRLQLRKQLTRYAEQTIAYTSGIVPGRHDELKKKTEKVKQAIRRLKNMVDTDNLNEEINTLFDSLYGNLMEIYLQQKTYAQDLVLLQERQGTRTQEINFTFAGEIQSIIRNR